MSISRILLPLVALALLAVSCSKTDDVDSNAGIAAQATSDTVPSYEVEEWEW